MIENGIRGDEITAYLAEHPEIDGYIILDDEPDMGCHMDRLILCRPDAGFLQQDFREAEMIHAALNAGK